MADFRPPPFLTVSRSASFETVFVQALKYIEDDLREEAACTTELDYTEETPWLPFLVFGELEEEPRLAAELAGKSYAHVPDSQFRWGTWAAPRGASGRIDHDRAMLGDDLRDPVDQTLDLQRACTGELTSKYAEEVVP